MEQITNTPPGTFYPVDKTVAFNELKGPMHTFQLVSSHRITNCPIVIILDAV